MYSVLLQYLFQHFGYQNKIRRVYGNLKICNKPNTKTEVWTNMNCPYIHKGVFYFYATLTH